MAEARRLKLDEHGLIPAIVQDQNSGAVLMVAYMNEESVRLTVETGDAWFWSRSRRELWHKGSTSGNYQHVVRMRVDCDADAILLEVDPAGPACHTGATSCFFEAIDDFVPSLSEGESDAISMPSASTGAGEGSGGASAVPFPSTGEGERGGGAGTPNALVMDELARVIAGRHAAMPAGSYVAELLASGIDRVAKKVGEESAETIIAAKNGAHDEIVWEVADLWFHTLVLLEAAGVPVDDVWAELARRRK